MIRLSLASLLFTGLMLTVSSAQDKKVEAPPYPKPKAGVSTGKGAKAAIPGEVDIHFLNGSTVRMLIQSEQLEVATAYGKLVVPVKDLRAIEFGLHFPEGVEAKIDSAVKDLGSGDYRTREKASMTLIDLGPFSYPAVLDATRIKDLETSQRAKELAKKLVANHPKKDLKTSADDKVITRTFTIVGKILTTTIKSKTEYFGDQELTLAKMRTLRAVGGTGQDLEFAIDASKYASAGQWMDTGYIVDGRTTISITAKGVVDVWPQQGGGYMSGPNGFQATQRGGLPGLNFGGKKIGGMLNLQQHCGMLLGKIGEEGEMFIVSERYEGMPESEGKLFLHIGPSQWNVQSAGQYDVRVSRKD
jgi:hypothetical protein